MLNIAQMTWKICQTQADFGQLLLMPWKMAKSLSNFAQYFNESSRYLAKVFSALHFWFEQNFVSFHLVNERNLSVKPKFADTYLGIAVFKP